MLPDNELRALEERRRQVIAAGDSLITGRLTGKLADGTVVSDARFTHLFAERDGRWQCVAGQSTPILQPPAR